MELFHVLLHKIRDTFRIMHLKKKNVLISKQLEKVIIIGIISDLFKMPHLFVVVYDLFREEETATDKLFKNKIKSMSEIVNSITLFTNKVNYHSMGNVKVLKPEISFKSKILNLLLLNLFVAVKFKKQKGTWNDNEPVFYLIGSFFIFLALYLKYIKKVKVIVDVDTWFVCYNYSEVIATFFWFFLEKFIEPLNKLFYSVTLNEYEASYLIKKGFSPNKVSICHIAAPNLSLNDKKSCRLELLREYGLPENSFLLAFHGPGNAPHNIETVKLIIQTANKLKEEKRMKFLIIGGGYNSTELGYLDKNESIIFTGFLDNEKMYCVLRGSDIYFCPIGTGFLGGTKTKMAEAAMLGLPVVTNRLGALGYNENFLPFLYDDDLMNSILYLYSSDNLLELGEKTRSYIIQNYSLKNMVKFYNSLFSYLS